VRDAELATAAAEEAVRPCKYRSLSACCCCSRRCNARACCCSSSLRAWRTRFDAHGREVDALGFDLWFRRMWDFYLAYCEAGFATGYLDVAQLVLSRP